MRYFLKLTLLSILIITCACENESIGSFDVNENTLDEELFELVVQIPENEGEDLDKKVSSLFKNFIF
jgi:hypothetical protein